MRLVPLAWLLVSSSALGQLAGIGVTGELLPARAAAPRVAIQRPYQPWARPRPKGDVAAAVADEELGRWNVGGTGDSSFASNRPGFHPGTRVIVETRVVSGKLLKTAPFDRRTGKHSVVLSDVSLLARTRKLGYWPFRLCWEEAARLGPRPKGGETIVRFSVDATGHVSHARVLRTKLDDPEIASCIAERALGLVLLPPPRVIGVEMSVQIWPGDVPVPLLPAPPPDAGELEGDALATDADALQPDFEACYAKGLARDPDLWGRIQLHVELDPKGTVHAARQAESRFPDPEVTSCIVRSVRATRFTSGKKLPAQFELAVELGELPTPSANITP